jgi:hypothetical protein
VVVTVRLRQSSFEYAQSLVRDGKVILDERTAWSDHRPSAKQENDLIDNYGIGEYRRWHLAEDDEEPEDTKARYKFPFGDFHKVHRCALLAAESRAGQYKYSDVEMAAAHLHGMIEAVNTPARRH